MIEQERVSPTEDSVQKADIMYKVGDKVKLLDSYQSEFGNITYEAGDVGTVIEIEGNIGYCIRVQLDNHRKYYFPTNKIEKVG